MKMLVVKTSSLGDVVHAMPAVNEAIEQVPGLEVSWAVEESFADIPALHPGVGDVIPVAIRRWRKNWWSHRAEILEVASRLREESYDLVIDSQGLIKSAILTRLARGERHGFDAESARESFASNFYSETHNVGLHQHAIVRQKQLFGAALGYKAAEDVHYGISGEGIESNNQIMLLHGTTWRSKEWPVQQWRELVDLIATAGYEVVIPAGNDLERQRAAAIINTRRGKVLDRLPLAELITEMRTCAGVVSVDTGLGHLAPALGLPVVGMFGSTDPVLTGILGRQVKLLVSDHLPCIPCRRRDCQYPNPGDSSSIYPPCYEQIMPETVWQALKLQIGSKVTKPD